MKFKEFRIPKIYKEIKLNEYAEELGEEVIRVWVNCPAEMAKNLVEADGRSEEEQGEMIMAILADLWEDATIEIIRGMVEQSKETDPRFMLWLVMQTYMAILRHRAGIKKA